MGRANARPMTGSAKQSRAETKNWIARFAPRNDENVSILDRRRQDL
jgi:hypothetical protein